MDDMAKAREQAFERASWFGEKREKKEINCEQTEILTALIMERNRDSATNGIQAKREIIVRKHVLNLKALIDFSFF